jgi:hypothetical protein
MKMALTPQRPHSKRSIALHELPAPYRYLKEKGAAPISAAPTIIQDYSTPANQAPPGRCAWLPSQLPRPPSSAYPFLLIGRDRGAYEHRAFPRRRRTKPPNTRRPDPTKSIDVGSGAGSGRCCGSGREWGFQGSSVCQGWGPINWSVTG